VKKSSRLALVAWALAVALLAPLALAGPSLPFVFPDDDTLTPGTPLSLYYQADTAGTLEVLVRLRDGSLEALVQQTEVPAGEGAVTWDGLVDGLPVPPGHWLIQLTLMDGSGAHSEPRAVEVTVVSAGAGPTWGSQPEEISEETPEETSETSIEAAAFTPSLLTSVDRASLQPGPDRQLSPFPDPHELCAWGLDIDRIDIYDPADQAKIWEVLMQPVTYLDVGPKDRIYPLVSPDADPKNVENLTGQIMGRTAAVHVLETLGNGWTRIEAFSADGYRSPDPDKFHGLANTLIHGYVRTNLLKTVKPYNRIGIVIDKYTQRMYIFRDGKLFTTVLISTGRPTANRPWNETPSGKFLVDSWVGKFPSGDMWCDLALRINGGCLMHEVPHRVRADGTRNYEPYESFLGQKASLGCVRVQRMRNNDRVNMGWLWNNLKRNTPILIWDDAGRAPIPVPEWALTMYHNPNGGKSYHSEQRCAAVRDRFLPLSPLPYEALYVSPTDQLIPCYGCVPFFKVPDPNAVIPDEVMDEGDYDEH